MHVIEHILTGCADRPAATEANLEASLVHRGLVGYVVRIGAVSGLASERPFTGHASRQRHAAEIVVEVDAGRQEVVECGAGSGGGAHAERAAVAAGTAG